MRIGDRITKSSQSQARSTSRLSLWCLLALVFIEAAVGLVRQSAKWLAIAIVAGCIASMVVAIQSLIVDHNASADYPGALQTPEQAKFFVIHLQ